MPNTLNSSTHTTTHHALRENGLASLGLEADKGKVLGVAGRRESRYILTHALLPPHIAFALNVQPAGCTAAAVAR